MTFAASANCALYCGAKPVFVDVKESNGLIDEGLIQKKITKNTKIIIPVHLGGLPANLEKLEIGDIDVKKEFNYAGDIMRAIWILMNQDKVFETVIGSGEAYSLKDWTKYCFEKIGKNWEDYVVKKEGFVSEYRILVSNPKLIKSLGWKPEVDMYKLADMMMEVSNDNSM